MSSEKTCSRPCSCATGIETPAAAGPVSTGAAAPLRSVFRIPGMDCPSEEQMIRLRLADLPVAALAFDLPGRQLVVWHAGDASAILARIVPLGYGAELQDTRPARPGEEPLPPRTDAAEASTLWILLTINAVMFVVEALAGWWAHSAGLISDAADMFADAAVYGVALYAVGRSARHKMGAAKLAGVLQLVLALGVLAEVGRRAYTGSFPEEMTMIAISLLALGANIACLAMISRHRQGGVHMRASYIFSANDVLANLGVIAAAALVAWTASPIPDWTIGALIGVLVLVGAFRILRLR